MLEPITTTNSGGAPAPVGGATSSPAPSTQAPAAEALSPVVGAAPPAPGGTASPAAEGVPAPLLAGGAAEPTSEPTPEPEPAPPSPIDPASYTFTFPDTFTPDDALLTSAREVLADAGVSPDKAQGVMDVYLRALEAQNSSAQAAFQAEQREWETAINAMPEFQGATRETSLNAIGRLIDEYGPEVRTVLQDPKVGNNPQMAAFMLKVATALSEGTSTSATRPPTSKRGKTLAERLYPNAN